MYRIENKPWIIYSLADPRTGNVRYIGKTNDLKRRLANHIREAKRGSCNHRLSWIRGLILCEMVPVFCVLETGVGLKWKEAERKWIKSFRDAGVDLVNGTDGGDGTEGYVHRLETRKRIAKSLTGKKFSPEHTKNLSESHKGNVLSPDVRAKLLEIFHSKEHREKLSIALRGKVKSIEHRAKLGAAHRGKIVSLETRKKISESRRGMVLSVEHRERIGNALRGKIRSAETKEKTSRSLRAFWERCSRIQGGEDV